MAKQRISNTKKRTALELASNLLDRYATIPEIYGAVTDLVDYANIDKIASAINPRAAKLENSALWIKHSDAIIARLDDEGRKLFLAYDNDWSERDTYRRMANFCLGYAVGIKLGRG